MVECPLALSGHRVVPGFRYWGKADMTFALHMSAYDPKRRDL
jgi:hypothetical protein